MIAIPISTHVLDARIGQPARDLAVELRASDPVGGLSGPALHVGRTDSDGRIEALTVPGAGRYQLVFDTGGYFAGLGVATFYPQVVVTFEVADPSQRHHVPLLLSPFSYSTYRGS